MKSLDEHLRDASQAWSQDATPTLVASADAIAKTLRPRSWWSFPWGLGALGLGIVVAVTAYVDPFSSAPIETPTAKRETPAIVAQPHVAQPQAEQPAVEHPAVVETTIAKQQHSNVVRESKAQAPSTRLKVEGDVDGFTAEYERVLRQAISYEATDPLRAVNEYMGLVRMCERREKYAHAVSALERATVLADQVGDVNLKHSVETKLQEIKGLLAP